MSNVKTRPLPPLPSLPFFTWPFIVSLLRPEEYKGEDLALQELVVEAIERQRVGCIGAWPLKPQRHIPRIRAATSAHRLALVAFAPSTGSPGQARHSNRSRMPSGMNRVRGAKT